MPYLNVALNDLTDKVRSLIRLGDTRSAAELIKELNTENTIIFLSMLLGPKLDLSDSILYARYGRTDKLLESLERDITTLSYMSGREESFAIYVIKLLINEVTSLVKGVEKRVSEFQQTLDSILDGPDEIEYEPNLFDIALKEILLKLRDDEIVTKDDEGNDGVSEFTLYGLSEPTPEAICKYVIPYLNGLIELQRILSVIKGEDFEYPYLRSIIHHNPLKITLKGIAAALKVVLDEVIPWRKQHAQQLASLEEESKELDNINKQITHQQAHIRFASVLKSQTAKDELRREFAITRIRKLKAEAETIEIENEGKRALMLIELSNRIIEVTNPEMTAEQRQSYLPHVLKALLVPATSSLSLDEPDETITIIDE